MSDALNSMQAITIEQIQRLTGFSKPKIYREINAGRLIARKCGRRTIVLVRDFERFINDLPKIGEQT